MSVAEVSEMQFQKCFPAWIVCGVTQEIIAFLDKKRTTIIIIIFRIVSPSTLPRIQSITKLEEENSGNLHGIIYIYKLNLQETHCRFN